jgi:energy-coupling factor transporter transmembrane protein EcfT
VDSPFIVAILVFLSVYLAFFLIRLFADFILVGIALISAIFTFYFLHDPEIYHTVIDFSKEVPLLSMLFQHLGLPEQLDQVDQNAIIVIASMITALAVLISIPFLPFSATYRYLFGVENPVFQRKEAKVRGWIVEEIENHHRQDEVRQAQLRSD